MNRRVMAARAASNGRVSTPNDIAMLRPQVLALSTGPVRRSTAVRMTATQRNSEGKRSEWNASMHYFTDAKWSQTVTSQR